MDLIPLSQIPYSARKEEAQERAKWPTRAMALDAASIIVFLRRGCYSGPEPPIVGYVLTRSAAQALSERVTKMPDGTVHRRLDYQDGQTSSEALDEYMQAIALGVPQSDALAQYKAAIR